MKKIIITSGDPAGIGPELISSYLRFHNLKDEIIYVVYGTLISNLIKDDFCQISDIDEATESGKIYHIDISDESVKLGNPSQTSGKIAIEILQKAALDLVAGKAEAVVTCPVSKNEIRKNDESYIGHTEFFAEASGTDEVVMSFWHKNINVALLTTHFALSNVSKEITTEKVKSKMKLIIDEAKKHWKYPSIALLGMNPHSGESGAFGDEDKLLKDVLNTFSDECDCQGPFPADTFFSRNTKRFNLIISAYHDQGLIPFKMLSHGQGVNVTLGLPFIRTSVDHGTAFDIAGKGKASPDSLMAAIQFAEKSMGVMNISNYPNYSYFAKFYDNYMSHVKYDEWVQKVINIYQNINEKEPKSIHELACGTANVARRLVQKGYEVEGSDLSAEMLFIASRKTDKPKLSRRNMKESFSKKYDMILLLFDSLNYLRSSADVSELFQNVATGLKEDSLFIFDISTYRNSVENFDGFVNFEDRPDDFIVHETSWNENLREQFSKLTFFKRFNGFYLRKDEVHKQKIFYVKEIIELIENSPLKLLEIHSTKRKLETELTSYYDKTYERLFFVLKKR